MPRESCTPVDRSMPRQKPLPINQVTTRTASSTPSPAPEPSPISTAATQRSKPYRANSSMSSMHASPTHAGGSPINNPKDRQRRCQSLCTSNKQTGPDQPRQCASTALRTSTPPRTCSSTTDRSPSATSGAISTPRFIGPGCITIAPLFIRSERATLIPYRA